MEREGRRREERRRGVLSINGSKSDKEKKDEEGDG